MIGMEKHMVQETKILGVVDQWLLEEVFRVQII